jgi:hypothetical protein
MATQPEHATDILSPQRLHAERRPPTVAAGPAPRPSSRTPQRFTKADNNIPGHLSGHRQAAVLLTAAASLGSLRPDTCADWAALCFAPQRTRFRLALAQTAETGCRFCYPTHRPPSHCISGGGGGPLQTPAAALPFENRSAQPGRDPIFCPLSVVSRPSSLASSASFLLPLKSLVPCPLSLVPCLSSLIPGPLFIDTLTSFLILPSSLVPRRSSESLIPHPSSLGPSCLLLFARRSFLAPPPPPPPSLQLPPSSLLRPPPLSSPSSFCHPSPLHRGANGCKPV